jgi:cellobiose phosphorylase
MGKRICSWYALWKAIYFIRRGDTAIAYDSVLQSIGECGAFYEMFEINEEAVSYRPWFATASAYVITAVNEMLLQKKGERIRILPCIPEHIKDVSFKLSTHGAVTVTFEMKDRKVNKLNIDGSNDEYIIELPKDVVYNGKEMKRENRFIRYEIRK